MMMGSSSTGVNKKEEEEGAAKVEWLSCIDSTTLSQSELHALSLSSLHPTSTRHLPTPKIDPTIFNESAGSHRQTYSRPRRRRRVAALLPPPALPSDHRLIIDYLKQLIREDPKFDQVELLQPPVPSPPEIFAVGERKRKRGRKPKLKMHLEDCYRGMEIVNKNGVPIDLTALATVDEPFAEELARRTEGLRGEEELLGFLSNLAGQWGSRRKKRRIVEAADFGDVLPLGWKLILGLKRKEGRAWIYCRRYISPSGQQFVSCKEVSSYLQSLFGDHPDVQFEVNGRSENMPQEQKMTAENSVGVTRDDQEQQQIVVTNSDVSGLSVSNERMKEVALLEMENLADVQIHDLFECHKCNMSFDEKDSYLQHLLSVHQKTTRRYRLGSSVGDGVIIKDGKFECQFCHKVFLERHRYNGHVGIHVRNYVRKAEDLPGQPIVLRADKSSVREEETPSRISKMDALIEIAQNSIMEDSVMEPHSLPELHMIPISEIASADLDQDINFESATGEQQMEDSLTVKNVIGDMNQQNSPCLQVAEEVEGIDDDNRAIDAEMFTFLDNMDMLSVNKQTVNAPGASNGKDEVAPTVEGFDQSGIKFGGVSQSPLPFKPDEENSNQSELKDRCKDVPVVASDSNASF